MQEVQICNQLITVNIVTKVKGGVGEGEVSNDFDSSC